MLCATGLTSLHVVGGEVQVCDLGIAGQFGKLLLYRLECGEAQALLALARLQPFPVFAGDQH